MGLFGPPDVKRLQAKGNIQSLIKALRYQDSWVVRRDAARALGELGDKRVVESLISLLKEMNENSTLVTQWKVGNKASVDPRQAYAAVGDAAVSSLGKLEDGRAVEPLIALLESRRKHQGFNGSQMIVVRVLGKLKDRRAVEPLIDLITITQAKRVPVTTSGIDKDYASYFLQIHANEIAAEVDAKELLKVVVEALGELGDARAVEPLIALLKNIHANAIAPGTREYRDMASDIGLLKVLARALGRIGDVRAMGPLLSLLKDQYRLSEGETPMGFNRNSSTYLPTIVEQSVEQIQDIRAVEPLIEALREGTGSLDSRITAARMLAKFRDRRATEPLIEVLKERASGMRLREFAAEALGQFGDPRAAEPLISFLEDSNEKDVVKEQIKADRARMEKQGSIMIQLVPMGKDSNLHIEWQLWRIAARALGELGYWRAVKPLVRLTADGEVARAAIEALQRTLERTATSIEPEDLRSVLHLEKVVQIRPSIIDVACDISEPVDCIQVKLLAQQELIRRGLKV